MRLHGVTLFIAVTALLLPLGSIAQEQNWGGRDSMNGIKLSDYRDFEKKWKLVTVRYRKDTGEQRFTYANPLAWKALQSKSSDYPKGAVFAKIGFITEEDRSFPSSAVPTGARRFQFMVRDKSKYAGTGGWGYALFQGTGVTYNEDPVKSAIACNACHAIVPERGLVFSEPVNFNPYVSALQFIYKDLRSRLEFKDSGPDALPPELRERLPTGTARIRLLTGAIQQNIFEGTLNEIRPALAIESLKSGVPAVLISDDRKSFSAVFSNPARQDCKTKQAATDMSVVFTNARPDPADPAKLAVKKTIVDQAFCWK